MQATQNAAEEYVSHPIYVNYEAARDGTIRNRRLGKSIGVVDKFSYLRIGINFQGKIKCYRAHRFIAEIFIGEIPTGYVIDHIDGNKTNNIVDNLGIVTQRENNLNKNPNQSKNRIPRPVTATELGNSSSFITDFPSMSSAAKYFNIDTASVCRAAEGKISATYSDKFNCKVSFKYV